MSILQSIFGDASTRIASKLQPRVDEINALESHYEKMSQDQMRQEIQSFRDRQDTTPEFLESILPRVFATVREASRHTLKQRHFDVQLMGGIILHEGKIAEMRTGEGKTLVATLSASLNAISGRGVHVVTVNDYLARRDAVWMGEIYHFLGFSVGCINHATSYLYDPHFQEGSEADKTRDELGSFRVMHEFLKPCSRQEAYRADITYGTNNEFGFDWLRDNLVFSPMDLAQREHHYAIVDEVDSILIDEARTPLIISAPDEEAEDLYKTFAHVARQLKKDADYTLDEKMRSALITDEGISKVEKMLGISDIYSERGIRFVRHLEQALRAESLFHRDRDYVVGQGAVTIVDEFTGRLMPGRRWSDGLHQAIEAKEGVPIQKESRTLATITFQNYFRMYEKVAGMTGTAQTSAEEFRKVYNLDVMSIPTHKPMIRQDHRDRIFQTENGKFTAIVKEVKERHQKGQPVLLGTSSIEKNEKISQYLSRAGVPHNMLNAKNHEREAEITAQAGHAGRVTIATNIAGRGVDIILGGNPPSPVEADKVSEVGGLFVLGTERHEARRIDNQLRGRSGRQGDPGESCFFLSLEDDLMRIFAPDRVKNLMGKLGIPEDEPIENSLVSRSIEQAQAKIEGLHFDTRKHLLEYDNVMSKQRTAIYRLRREILLGDEVMLETKIRELLELFAKRVRERGEEPEALQNMLSALLSQEDKNLIPLENLDLPESIYDFLEAEYQLRIAKNKAEFLQNARFLFLQLIDMMWRDHLEVMEYTRSSVGLRAYGQRDPLVEYKNEAHRLFKTFNDNLAFLFTENLFKIGTVPSVATKQKVGLPRSGASASVKTSAGKKVGRNDPCPCGSGKKYKKCHGK
ncbi:MAG: preprotein translocase subunit SecA [Candidatus Ryanbacteria bacterium]|nr:preprotein translocase subunit SecA [Candidatus Ryanbacteria bacterium]